MNKKIAYETLYNSQNHWLNSRFHFSFAEYHNPKNIQFGILRVLNDDIIAPHSGFDTHPHHDMEIITYVIDGELTHTDSMGNSEVLYSGDIQYMSAGTGITHAERNESDKPLHLVQLWILPEAKGLTPQYGSKKFVPFEKQNRWLHAVGYFGSGAVISVYQDVNIFVSQLESGHALSFEVRRGRQVYLKVLEGEGIVNGEPYLSGDAGEFSLTDIQIESYGMHVMLIEMAKS